MKRPYGDAGYVTGDENANGDTERALEDIWPHSDTKSRNPNDSAGISTVELVHASSRGVRTTGARRVRNTPPRMAAAPTDWAAVIGSPIQSQPTTIAAIGVRLL